MAATSVSPDLHLENVKLKEKNSRLGADLITARMAACVSSDLQCENVKLKEKVSRLEAELVTERDFSQQAQLRTKLDMCLDLMQEGKKHDKTKQVLAIAKRQHEKAEVKWLETLTETESELSKEKAKRISAESRAEVARAEEDASRMEVERLEFLNANFVADLADLRAIDVEEATKRADEHRGLPPAYGNLDDEDRFPPYSRHEDACTIELAHFKRCVRRQFDKAIARALRRAASTKKPKVCRDLFRALDKACYSIASLMDAAPEVPVPTRHELKQKYLDQFPTAPPRTLIVGALTDRPDSTAFINDRIAKLIIELLWRTVGVCSVRPSYACYRGASGSFTTDHFRIDVVLTAALQYAFSKKRSLPKLQFYLSQLSSLTSEFNTLFNTLFPAVLPAETPYGFFRQATTWLSEQIEKEREISAMAGENDDAKDVVSDGVSSRWEGSDVSGGDGSVASDNEGSNANESEGDDMDYGGEDA